MTTTESPRLELLPAVDVRGGRAVQLQQGVADSGWDFGDPLQAAQAWQEQGAEWIHLVDLDAAFGTGNNRDLLAGIVGNVIQHRLVWSTESLKLQFSKVSPLAGAKRLFSLQAIVNFLKGLVKIVALGAVMTALMWPQRHRLDTLVSTDILASLLLTKSLALNMAGTVVAILFLVAAADYLYQYRQWFERQKMSMRELKEEFKQTEGDPMIKGKIRQLRQQRMRKRMMAAVPKASVVITNPTHYAVALQYEKGMEAPVCVAKGADNMALMIREIAKKHSIPIVENPPLARALHATVEIDDEIPTEHYKAVAEVIGYITKLRRGAARK